MWFVGPCEFAKRIRKMLLPYELFFHIVSFASMRSIHALSQTCRAAAGLSTDENLFKRLVQTRYNPTLQDLPCDLEWKDVFAYIYALRRRIALKHVQSSLINFVSYDVFVPKEHNVSHTCNCVSCFGYNVMHTKLIGQDGKFLYFNPLVLPPMYRKINLYAVNFENHARKLKFSMDSNCSSQQELDERTRHVDAFPPFDWHMVINDGMCLWSPTLKRYVLVYSMQSMFTYFCKKHGPSMEQRIGVVERNE